MSVGNILSLTSAKMGMNPSVQEQRDVLLRFLNEAAYEVYIQSDMAGSLVEQLFKINGDQTVSLPNYVGEIRGIREYNSMIPWSINQMRPRYNVSNWSDTWRGYRLKGRQPLMASITNESVLVITVPTADDTLDVTVTGRTELASQITETVTMTETSMDTENDFLEIVSISKNKVTNYDVTVSDVDGKLLTVIPNNELQSWYQIVDISAMPWLPSSQSSTDHYVEILYKKTLPVLSNDGDEFPAQGYDYILSNKIMQLWSQEQGKADISKMYDDLTSRSLSRKHEEMNRATQDKIGLVPNPHDTLTPRIRPRRPGRYGGYGGIGSRYGL